MMRNLRFSQNVKEMKKIQASKGPQSHRTHPDTRFSAPRRCVYSSRISRLPLDQGKPMAHGYFKDSR